MTSSKADIITTLRKELLSLQGFTSTEKNADIDLALGKIKNAFPNATFPTAAIHEFVSNCPENTAATGGFVSVILAALMKTNGVVLWASASRNIFPPAMLGFDIDPDRIIFIDVRKEKQILWVMEESLKCKGIAAVIGEIQEINFTDSRRLQLATEHSKVPGILLRRNPKTLNATTCVARWQVRSLHSQLLGEMPGVGFPNWNIELLKVRNGQPGSWQVEYVNGKLSYLNAPTIAIPISHQKIAG